MGTRSENDLNDLIQQILGMAGEEGKARRKKMEEDSSDALVERRAKTATDEYNLMMGRTPELKLEAAKGANTLANTQETNIGAMARQQLAGRQGMELGQQKGEFDLAGHRITSAGTIAASENRLAGDTRRAEATETAATIGASGKTDARAKLLETWAGGMNPTLESLDIMQKGYDKLYPAKNPDGVPPPVTPVSAATKIPPPPILEETPASSTGETPTKLSPARASLTGGKSMEFRREGSLSPEEEERRRKASNRRMFYGTKFAQ